MMPSDEKLLLIIMCIFIASIGIGFCAKKQGPKPYQGWKLYLGKEVKLVECKTIYRWDCGLSLSECKDGLEYHCVSGVKLP